MKIPIENIQTRFLEHIYKQTIAETGRFYNYDLERGRKILESEEECVQYLIVYGGMHYHKLISAFSSTQFEKGVGRNIEIIDWGSGIATASTVLIDYLIEKKIELNIEKITLIEPSIPATDKGRELLYKIFQNDDDIDSSIKIINKSINDVKCEDIETEPENIKVHLFSNIVDVQGIELNHLYNLVVSCFHETNRIICTSPKNDYEDRVRLDEFYRLFNSSWDLRYNRETSADIVAEDFRINSWDFEERPIKRYEKQFTISLPSI